MINKALSHISLTDIRPLVANSVPEGTTLDYKKTYSLATDREKGEFLADISSFANTLGGDLVFGIRDENGFAKELTDICRPLNTFTPFFFTKRLLGRPL